MVPRTGFPDITRIVFNTLKLKHFCITSPRLLTISVPIFAILSTSHHCPRDWLCSRDILYFDFWGIFLTFLIFQLPPLLNYS
mgnify:CR=1 FL=1